MTLRPMRPADLEAVNRLHRSVWWPARSRAGWAWLWSNPATRALHSPNGWVIDNGGGAVACAGNFIQRFWLDDRALYGATGYSIIVPPDQRGRSRDLIHAFVNQPGCFARYTLNANARSSPLYKRHGMTPWPPLTHDVKLSWLVDPLACLTGAACAILSIRRRFWPACWASSYRPCRACSAGDVCRTPRPACPPRSACSTI